MHPPLLRGGPPDRPRGAALPLPRRLVRHGHRPADRRPAPAAAVSDRPRAARRGDLRHRRGGADDMRRPFTREQRTTVVSGILCLVLILVVLQLWLLMATMNAHLGGD